MSKNSTLLFLAFLIHSVSLVAQNKQGFQLRDLEHLRITGSLTPPVASPEKEKCGFEYEMNQAKLKGFNDAAYEQEMRRLIELKRQMRSFGPPTVTYTLPVIFHVIYDGNTEAAVGTGANLSQNLINAQIEQLNKDFADLSGSVYGVAEDMGVRFVAAKVDEGGNVLCEPGIERINWRSRNGWSDPTTLADIADVTTHYRNIVKPQSIWDPYQYVNIWVANFDESGLLGVATFPSQSTLAGLDEAETDATAGVVVLSGSVGSLSVVGTAVPYQSGRTLTHELGHFFGLRHITGDAGAAGCGDDYCADTPPQDELTSGCPATGTLNNCLPSGPKMFENYMDYTSDACLNTFTLNQSERCQAVMLNSPRRKELASSTRGNSVLTNRIYFKPGVSSISENATGLCPRFKDYNITVAVEGAATGNATISLVKSGTATEQIDYSIQPASVSFTNGDAGSKTFTLRIFDDAAIESNEVISLGLNIVGTGVVEAPGCGLAQFSFTINDDDKLLGFNNNASIVTLLSEDFGVQTGSNQIPSGWTVSGATTNKWVANGADAAVYGFTGNTLHISDGNRSAVNNGTAPIKYSLTSTTDARVFTPTLPALGFRNISISLNFVSNGEEDQDGIYDYGIVYYSLDGTNFSPARDINNNFVLQGISTLTPVTLYLPAGALGTNSLRFLFRWLSDNNTGEQPPFAIDDVVVKGLGVTIETELNNNVTESIPAGAVSSYFYSTSDGQVIGNIQNSSEPVACATANIQSAGVGITMLNTTTGSYLRSEKVIAINPALANTTATYQATFYFTTAELAAWGANFANIQLMKVKSGVNLGTTVSAADMQLVPASVSDLRSTKGYVSFTGNFTGGFSQFMLVAVTGAVPVTLLNFSAQATPKNIVLDWATSTELNNKGFAIQRSEDAVAFTKIGWVDGKITSSSGNSYQYIDNNAQPGVVYYYRLVQTDLDGKESFSEIRQGTIKDNSLQVFISPNPAKNVLRLLIKGSTGVSYIRLLNANGQVIHSWRLNASSAPQLLDISNKAAGVYMVQVVTNQATLMEKIIIE